MFRLNTIWTYDYELKSKELKVLFEDSEIQTTQQTAADSRQFAVYSADRAEN